MANTIKLKHDKRVQLRQEFIDVTENTFVSALYGRSGSLRAREIRSRAINHYGGIEL
jgi:hypothetical protein